MGRLAFLHRLPSPQTATRSAGPRPSGRERGFTSSHRCAVALTSPCQIAMGEEALAPAVGAVLMPYLPVAHAGGVKTLEAVFTRIPCQLSQSEMQRVKGGVAQKVVRHA